MHPRIFRTILTVIAIGLSSMPTIAAESLPTAPSATSIRRAAYQGWPNAIILGNGLVEAVIVPEVGRILQFRFAGEAEGPVWVNPALAGRVRDPASREWANFGGDKAWPGSGKDWPRIFGRTWPPPFGFDGTPEQAVCDGSTVTLVSVVDPDYGIRVRRRIELTPGQPVMTITTRFEKTAGAPLDVSIWTVTQADDPVRVCAILPQPVGESAAYLKQSDDLPAGLKVAGRLLTVTRDLQKNTKIGMRAGTLLWIGAQAVLRIDAPLVPGATYPDDGCSAEIYTNADPLPYIEMEILGPVTRLVPGASLEHQSTYTLARRTGSDPDAEIQALIRP